MEKSLVVTGRTLEAALDKAAMLLHCPQETIAYEILREGVPAHRGNAAVLWKIRAMPVAPALDDALASSSDQADAYIPLPDGWPEWVLLPSPAFLSHLGTALASLPALLKSSAETAPFSPLRTIAGDFGRTEQTLSHNGDVRVEGSVLRGAHISAAGTLHIAGDVETAQLEAHGTVIIDGGILGTARSLHGDVSCRFAQGARLSAPQGTIRVLESAMHSHLDAGQTVRVGHVFLGGTAYAEELIEADTVGSLSGVPTLLTAGRNLRLRREAEDARTEASHIVTRLAEWNTRRQEWIASEEAGQPLHTPTRMQLWQTLGRIIYAQERLQSLARKKTASLGMINQSRGSRICVEGRAYPKVRVTIDDVASELQATTQFATFSKDYESGELRITPYR